MQERVLRWITLPKQATALKTKTTTNSKNGQCNKTMQINTDKHPVMRTFGGPDNWSQQMVYIGQI
jgi:hypothetical protein